MRARCFRAATAVVLRYKGASSLSIDNGLQAKPGDHVHFETVIGDRPASALAEQQHAIAFTAKLTRNLTSCGRPLNLTFRPGISHPVLFGTPGVSQEEVGNPGLESMMRRPFRRNESAPHLIRAAYREESAMSFHVADCSGPIILVKNSSFDERSS